MNLQLVSGFFLIVLPIVLIVLQAWKLGKRSDFYENILLSSGSVLLSILLYLKVYSMRTGQSAFDAVWNSFRQVLTSGAVNTDEILSRYHELGIFKNFTSAQQLADFMIQQMKQAVPASLLIYSIVHGAFLFLVICFIMKKSGRDMRPVPAYAEWKLPRGMGFGLIVLLLITLFGSWMGIPNFEVVYSTVTALISFLFMVLGLSALWFFLKAVRIPFVFRLLLAVFLYLLLGFGLPLLGILDHIFRLRKRYRDKFILNKN